KHNEPLDDALFAFDTQGSQAVNSLAALMSGGGGGGGGRQAHPLENQPVPPIELPTLQGQPFRLADVKAGVVVLDFWATWCPPCREGLPHIQAIHDWAKREGLSVAVYAVNVGETEREVQAFWNEQGYTMPVLMDQQTKVAGAYGVQGIPQTVVIADGKVQHVHVGYNPAMENQLKSEIQSLLSQSATPPPAPSGAQ
ncbi:MAG TPA: TlpA disulfide reductase family protein, partial [Phycisphaeraceae bacterium]